MVVGDGIDVMDSLPKTTYFVTCIIELDDEVEAISEHDAGETAIRSFIDTINTLDNAGDLHKYVQCMVTEVEQPFDEI